MKINYANILINSFFSVQKIRRILRFFIKSVIILRMKVLQTQNEQTKKSSETNFLNILIIGETANEGLSVFARDFNNKRFAHSRDLKEFNKIDGILTDSDVPENVLDKNLLAIARLGTGANDLPRELCQELGIIIFHTPGAYANSVKELTILALINSSRNAFGVANKLKNRALSSLEREKNLGVELAGKTIGIIGLGATGALVANVCRDLGMRVLGFDPYISVDAAWALSRGVRKALDLNSIAEESDYISAHIPVNFETAHMFCVDFFNKTRKCPRLVNFSEPDLVNYADLINALRSGQIAFYSTDYPVEALMEQDDIADKILMFPNISRQTEESVHNQALMAATQLRDYLLYGNIKNSENFPDCALPYVGKRRICIAHKNATKIVGPITNMLAEAGLNIDNMLSKSKGENAYTMIDVDIDDSPPGDFFLLKKLLDFPNIIRAREILI